VRRTNLATHPRQPLRCDSTPHVLAAVSGAAGGSPRDCSSGELRGRYSFASSKAFALDSQHFAMIHLPGSEPSELPLKFGFFVALSTISYKVSGAHVGIDIDRPYPSRENIGVRRASPPRNCDSGSPSPSIPIGREKPIVRTMAKPIRLHPYLSRLQRIYLLQYLKLRFTRLPNSLFCCQASLVCYDSGSARGASIFNLVNMKKVSIVAF
jgi:hypothetical protein